MSKADILVARQSFWCRVDGKKTLVNRGATIRADHPIAKAHANQFKPFVVTYDTVERAPAPVEQATASPGEKRTGPGRPRLPRDAEGNIIRDE